MFFFKKIVYIYLILNSGLIIASLKDQEHLKATAVKVFKYLPESATYSDGYANGRYYVTAHVIHLRMKQFTIVSPVVKKEDYVENSFSCYAAIAALYSKCCGYASKED